MPNGEPVNASAQSTVLDNYTVWPNQQSLQFQYPYTYWPVPASDDYANEVEVAENQHDAVLTFYRRRGASRSQVKVITVPKALLAQFAPRKEKK